MEGGRGEGREKGGEVAREETSQTEGGHVKPRSASGLKLRIPGNIPSDVVSLSTCPSRCIWQNWATVHVRAPFVQVHRGVEVRAMA